MNHWGQKKKKKKKKSESFKNNTWHTNEFCKKNCLKVN